jgi:hypothetical protein
VSREPSMQDFQLEQLWLDDISRVEEADKRPNETNKPYKTVIPEK